MKIDDNSQPMDFLLLSPSEVAAVTSSGTGSPSKLPQRVMTDPEGSRSSPDLRMRSFKRIIVFCDGTWQDGLTSHSSAYTNVLRLARSVNYSDERYNPSIPQVVYYQSGVGTEDNIHSKLVDGATGGDLAEKVEEAYAFIAHNYCPGDEIFLFGFSRGAYTARMVAMFVGAIGVLDRRDMDHFADIFKNFQELGDSEGDERKELEEKLAPWRKADAKGKLRADIDRDKFTIKCLGVWDTVGALGLPKELMPIPLKKAKLFGFPDQILGEHIENAFQAMALHEMRSAFSINKFIQKDAGIAKKQTLKQCWFAGCHTDIGGGYEEHDLSDISLFWMAAQIESILSLDLEYLKAHVDPVAEWGKQKPHDSATGIFMFADKTSRALPKTADDPETHETIHESVLQQDHIPDELSSLLKAHPNIVAQLTEFERQMRQTWPYNAKSQRAEKYGEKSIMPDPSTKSTTSSTGIEKEKRSSIIDGLKNIVRSVSLRRKPRVAGAVTTSEIGEADTVGVAVTATLPKQHPKKSRSKQES